MRFFTAFRMTGYIVTLSGIVTLSDIVTPSGIVTLSEAKGLSRFVKGRP